MAFEFVRNSFASLIRETSNALGIMPSTAIILLARYEWNMSALVEDYNSLMRLEPLLEQCAHVAPNSLNQERECCVCNLSLLSWEFNCGHSICSDCFPGAVSNQLNTSTLIICPDPNCNYFINYSNLPFEIRTIYLTSLLMDYVDTMDKRSCFAKCVDMAWSHRKKVISAVGTIALFGLCVYKVKQWEEENPIKAWLVRFGISKL